MRIPLANLLVRSPLPRIEELMQSVIVCCEQVPVMIEALIENDQAAILRLAREVSTLEGHADEVKNKVRGHMPVRLFLPVDRRDALRLVSEIDAVADCAEDVGVLLTLRTLEVPEEMATVLHLFVERVMDTVRTAGELTGLMDSLVQASFAGSVARRAESLIQELGQKEHEADKLQDQCAKTLFKAEDRMAPMAVFMWTKVLNKIGDMANHAENVGDQFRLFLAR